MAFLPKIQVYDGDSNGLQLHTDSGFTGSQAPDYMLSAENGEMQIRFITDSTKNAGGFSVVFSADCPVLSLGEGKLLSNIY